VVGGKAKPVKLMGPYCVAVCLSRSRRTGAGSTFARNSGAKRAVTSASVRVAAPPLSWASSQVSCSPTGVAGIDAIGVPVRIVPSWAAATGLTGMSRSTTTRGRNKRRMQ
jgi:hypothetical protein